MAKMRASSREDAMKIARYVGCSGAHQDKKGNWIPCANPEDLVEILDKSARNSSEKLTKKKRRRFINGQWERLGERGPISIDTIEGGGLVSGMGKSLTQWFKEEWVDISRPKKGGGFEACGRDDADKGKYPKCVPASRASNMSEEEIRSAVSRKRRAESTQSRDDKKPIYVPTDKKNDPFVLEEKSAIPTNPELYARVKAEAKKKFDVYPSAYANAWLVREYKKRGGGYRSEKTDDGDYEESVEDLTEMQLSDFIDWVDQKEKAEKVCPPATSDIGLNIKNRQNAINTAGYGPLNPKEPNVDFWEKKAKRWSVTIEESKKQKCGNCAVFIKTSRILECIESGLGNEAGDTAWDVVNAGDLGYCEAFDFKCASARTCDAWVGGGPITVEKGKQEEKADTSTIIIGRAKPRIGDPDVYTDPNSARLRSRKLGCIGIARRETPDGEVVWTPCTNISDQRRYQGETPLGQRDEARRFADRLAEVGGPDRKRRRMRKFKSLEFTTDIKAFRTLGSSIGGRVIGGSCREFTGIDGDGDGLVCNPATREDDLPLKKKPVSITEAVDDLDFTLDPEKIPQYLKKNFAKNMQRLKDPEFADEIKKIADDLRAGLGVTKTKKKYNRDISFVEMIRRNERITQTKKLQKNIRESEVPDFNNDTDDPDFTLDPEKIPQFLKRGFAGNVRLARSPEFAEERKKIADDLRLGLGIAAVRIKYNRDTSLVDVVRRLEKIPKLRDQKKVDPKIRQDIVDLVDKLIKDDNPFMSVAEIAKEFEITGMDARRIINAAKLEKYFDLHNKYTDAKRKKLFAEVASLHKLDLTYDEIGKRLGISGDAVNHIVKKMKLPLRRPGGGGGLPRVIKRGGVMIPRSLAMKQNKEMLDLYQRGYSLTDIAKEMGIGVATVREIIKKFADNDKVRVRGNNVTEKENQIRKLLKEGLHPREIMRDIIGNVTYSRILEIAKEEDIKIPPMRKFKSDNQNFDSFLDYENIYADHDDDHTDDDIY